MAFTLRVIDNPESSSKSTDCPLCKFRNEAVVFRSENITKSPTDKKAYRYIRLANGLKAVLVSEHQSSSSSIKVTDGLTSHSAGSSLSREDTSASLYQDIDSMCIKCQQHMKATGGNATSAAAMCVQTGFYNDPPDFPGLAHMLEHMVFMGSEKFPDVNDFDSFCAKHGALMEPNARTDCETLVFFFDIDSCFSEALYRFAQFFISPLLKKECIEKEISAIDHEYKTAMSNDNPRKQTLLASFAEKNHPAAKFVWGNRQTLKTDPERKGKNLHAALKDFQKKAFVADRMNLALYSSASLDNLELWVARFFSPVSASKPDTEPEKEKELPFKPEKFAKIVKVVPVMSTRELDLTWCLPSQVKHYRTKPLSYLSWVIGNECHGSLISYLKKKLWATSLWCQNGTHGIDHNSFWSAFSITITLTADGQERLEEILLAVFSYLAMMREAGPQKRIFDEIKTIYHTAFHWEEDPNGNELCEILALHLHHYAVQDVLTGPMLFTEYKPQLIIECLNHLVPSTVNISVYSRDFEKMCDRTEQWFHTKYCVQDMDKSLLARLENVTPYPEFCLPEENGYIATDFRMVETPEDKKITDPEVVLETAKCKMWYRRANRFESPKVFLSFHMISPLVSTSPQSGVLFDLFVHHIEQNLVESTFLANLADLWHSFDQEKSGMTLHLDGFRDKFERFFNIVADSLANFEADTGDFLVSMEAMGNFYHNLIINPHLYARELLKSALHQIHFTAKDKAPYLKNVDFDLLTTFVTEFKQSVFVEGYATGNLTEKDAVAYMLKFVEKLQPKEGLRVSSRHLNFLVEPLVLPSGKLPEVRMVELPLGDRVFKTQSLRFGDSSATIINYYQIGQANLRNEVMGLLLMSLMTEPCFAYLRTKEQLGYEAACYQELWNGIMGISIVVETDSAKFSMEEVDEKIEKFLTWFGDNLTEMSVDEFEEKVQTEMMQLESDANGMEEEAKIDWNEIFSQEYVFDRHEVEADILSNMSLRDFLAWYRLYMATPLRRKLSIQVYGCLKRLGSPPREEEMPSSKKARTAAMKPSSKVKESLITTIEEFKSGLYIYPTKRKQPPY